MLQQWRRRRALSQLGLSLDAGVSQRHLSFLESGRSRPSREMVLMLAGALGLPLRERNAMLAAAGFAPMFREEGLAGLEAEPVRRALGFMLDQQEPYPGIVIDGHWNLLMANAAAGRMLAEFLDLEAFAAAHCGGGPPNILKLTVHPDGLRPWIVNWPDLALALWARVRREAAAGAPDPALLALVEEVEAMAPKPDRLPDWAAGGSAVADLAAGAAPRRSDACLVLDHRDAWHRDGCRTGGVADRVVLPGRRRYRARRARKVN